MPNINGGRLVHVPRPKPRRGDKAKEWTRTKTEGVRTGGGRAKRAAGTAWGNATSKPGSRGKWGRGGEFGSIKPGGRLSEERFERRYVSGYGGTIAGLAGGMAVGQAKYGKELNAQQKKLTAQRTQIRSNAQKTRVKKGLRPQRPHLITDLGTKNQRARDKRYERWPNLSKPAFGAGAAVGGGYMLAAYSGQRKINERQLKTQQATLNRQKKKLVQKNTTLSAFGVDHG